MVIRTSEMSLYSSSNRCLEVDALVHCILSFLHIPDLFPCKLVCRTWGSFAVRCLEDIAKHPDYCCFTYLLHGAGTTADSWKSNKKTFRIQRQLARIHNRQQRRTGGLLLFGGAFGAPNHKPVYIHDYHIGLFGGLCRHITDFFPGDKQGAVASFYDPNEEDVVVLGGWDEEREQSLTCVMKLSVADLQPVRPSHSTDTETHSEDEEEEDRSMLSSSSSSNSPSRKQSWRRHSNLPERICYGAATMTLTGDILHVGGGNTPFRGARVFDHSYLYSQSRGEWLGGVVGKMQEVRCGHSAVTLLDGKVMVIGGYGGELLYYESAELFDFEKQQWCQISPMKHKRSGMVAVMGPGGSVYVTGGSSNGEIGQRALERYDAREGKWTTLAAMQRPRGYLTGALTASMHLYVNGGLHDYRFQGGMERYDIRQNVWETLIGSSRSVLAEPGLANFPDFPVECISSSGLLPSLGFPDEELIRAGHQLHYIY